MKYDKNHALLECEIPGVPRKCGKVRDVFDLGDKLLMVVTDRISAFDVILPCGCLTKARCSISSVSSGLGFSGCATIW